MAEVCRGLYVVCGCGYGVAGGLPRDTNSDEGSAVDLSYR